MHPAPPKPQILCASLHSMTTVVTIIVLITIFTVIVIVIIIIVTKFFITIVSTITCLLLAVHKHA